MRYDSSGSDELEDDIALPATFLSSVMAALFARRRLSFLSFFHLIKIRIVPPWFVRSASRQHQKSYITTYNNNTNTTTTIDIAATTQGRTAERNTTQPREPYT